MALSAVLHTITVEAVADWTPFRHPNNRVKALKA